MSLNLSYPDFLWLFCPLKLLLYIKTPASTYIIIQTFFACSHVTQYETLSKRKADKCMDEQPPDLFMIFKIYTLKEKTF